MGFLKGLFKVVAGIAKVMWTVMKWATLHPILAFAISVGTYFLGRHIVDALPEYAWLGEGIKSYAVTMGLTSVFGWVGATLVQATILAAIIPPAPFTGPWYWDLGVDLGRRILGVPSP